MYISESYKVGVIYNEAGNTLINVRCRATVTDETVYNTLKALSPLVDSETKLYRVSTVLKNILDKAPEMEEVDEPDQDITTEDTTLTLPAQSYILNNMVFTDADIYGDKFDGVNRRYRLIWKDAEGTEHFVPLEGIDSGNAVNPNGSFSYNSETKQLIFSAFMPYEVEYILRRYVYSE